MKNKVFWVRKNNLQFTILIGVIVGLISYFYFYSKDNMISYTLQSLFDGQLEIVLIGLFVAFLYQFVIGFKKLIVTKNGVVYTTLFTKKEFAKTDYQIVGVGAKEEYYPGHGDESGSTEYWHQLNIVNKQSLQVFEIKVKSSKQYYQKMVSYLKINELNDQPQLKQEQHVETYSFIPSGMNRSSKKWTDNLIALVIGAVFTFLIYRLIPIRLLETKWQALIVLGIFFSVGVRNISFKKRIPLQKIDISKERISINGVHYKDEEIIRFAMSASSDVNKKNDVHLLNVVFDDGGRNQSLAYQFNIDYSQLAEYQILEENLLRKYGEKYQLLFSQN